MYLMLPSFGLCFCCGYTYSKGTNVGITIPIMLYKPLDSIYVLANNNKLYDAVCLSLQRLN